MDNKPSTVYNFHGQVGEGEIVQNNKGFKDDEMYDGGENEGAENGQEENDAEQEDGRIAVLESLEDFENSLKNDGPICIIFTDRSSTVCANLDS